MNTEETIIMNPNNGKDNETQNKSNAEVGKNSDTVKKSAAMAGSAFLGGAAGAGGVYAATVLNDTDDKDEEKKEEPSVEETDAKDNEAVAAAAEPKEEKSAQPQPKHETARTEVKESVSDDDHEGPDYTGHNGANPTTQNPEVHHAASATDTESASVRVVGIHQTLDANGNPIESVVVTNGEDVAVIVDTDGNGTADVLAVDTNHNEQFEQNEIHDVSGENWQMEGYEQAYDHQNNLHHDSQAYTDGNHADSSDTNEVQVLGVYQTEGENGQTMEAAVLTNGQEVAAVVDVDGDGYVDILAVDQNHNQQIEEGEVYDVSSEQVHMSGYEQQYIAQQQEQEQMQQEDSFNYTADDSQPDYNNDAEPDFV